MTHAISSLKSTPNHSVLIAWPVMLLVSSLTNILFVELTGSLPTWLFGAKLALISTLLLGSLFWTFLRPLHLFFVVLLSLYSTFAVTW